MKKNKKTRTFAVNFFYINDMNAKELIEIISLGETGKVQFKRRIISPGKLPNALTIEEIKYGNPVIRNHLIAMFGSHTIPYSGLGSGLKRAIKEQPDIELIND